MRPTQVQLPDGDLEPLLKELIDQGLSITAAAPTQNRADSEAARYHVLLKVLSQACVTGFVSWLQIPGVKKESELESKKQQAAYTITILSRQIEVRPELLVSTAPDEPDTPLFKWLLPCVINSAGELRMLEGCTVLADGLISVAVCIVRALGTDLACDDDTVNYGRGAVRLRECLCALQNCLKDVVNNSSYPLHLFSPAGGESRSQIDSRQFETSLQPLVPNVKAAPFAAVAIAEVLITSCIPTAMVPYSLAFTGDITASSVLCLSSVWRFIQKHAAYMTLAAELARVIGLALKLGRQTIVQPVLQWSVGLFAGEITPGRQWLALSSIFDDLHSSEIRLSYLQMISVPRLIEVAQTDQGDDSAAHAAASALVFLCNASGFDLNQLEPLRGSSAGRGGVWDQLAQCLGECRGMKRKRHATFGSVERDRVIDIIREHVDFPIVSDDEMESLRQRSVDEFIKFVEHLVFEKPSSSTTALERARMLSPLFCALACPEACNGSQSLPAHLLNSWSVLASTPDTSPDFLVAALDAEYQMLRHAGSDVGGALATSRDVTPTQLPWTSMLNKDRQVRLSAGRVLVQIYRLQGTLAVIGMAASQRKTFLQSMSSVLSTPMKETAILILGEIGRDETSLPDILDLLIPQLGASSSPVRSLAYSEILTLCRRHGKAPYPLILPHIERISILLASHLVVSPDIVAESMRLMERTRQNFFETTVRYTLPALVVNREKATLDLLASIVKQPLGVLLVDHSHLILAKIFMTPPKTEAALAFLVEVLQSLTRGHGDREVTAASVITTCIIHFLVELVIELGSRDRQTVAMAETALAEAGRVQRGKPTDLGSFLKPHMLGVISHMNDVMHDIQGRKTVDIKRKVIRSLGALAKRVGGTMASFSPQIMASLQSTLDIAPLREETLRSWHVFVSALKFVDIGPYVGATTAALVANWDAFTPAERTIAVKTIDYLVVDNSAELDEYMDDVVGMAHIEELKKASTRLRHLRKDWSFIKQVEKLLERSRSENICISTRSVAELRDLLIAQRSTFTGLAKGDAFDPLVGQCMRTLFVTATRDGDRQQDLRDLSYECIGILGALDPDRIKVQQDETTMTLQSNFADQEESQDFALHLIRDVLVGAFRSTNDTKHQGHLAYAIQELLKFCGFTPKILSNSKALVPKSIYDRWETLPKDQLETVTPLLEARFTVGEVHIKTFAHPIYPTVTTYREWLQYWTTDLIGKVMSTPVPTDPLQDRAARALKDSQAIFGVFRGVLRNQDVSVAHHILPHLVLTVLCSGDRKAISEITAEINTVLEDQVNPQEGSPDRRSLSAQVVFGLMDHLSRWLLLQRQATANRDKRKEPLNDRKDADLIAVTRHIRTVDGVLAAIETELTANAALQSKAYARSLRNFEQRITKLRLQSRPDNELQTYFENLHHIYADLEEPDGMEGISSMILAPTLQTQIREHESTGRWTSAQSCWEVRLQQKPDEVSLHVGLLRCLRNLGHYDTLRTHIRGVLSRYPEWLSDLAAFQVEAAWMVGDWTAVQQVIESDVPQSAEVSLGRVLLAMRQKNAQLPAILTSARRELGAAVTASGQLYPRAYDSVLSLHQLHEIEMIRELENLPNAGSNKAALMASRIQSLTSALNSRFQATLPSYKVRESLLSMRRTAYGLSAQAALRAETGLAWISSAKIARKTGHEQTAYSATLQARELDAPFAFVQQAKLLHSHDGAFKALVSLEHGLRPLLKTANSSVVDLTKDDGPLPGHDRHLAKAVLLEARWADETKRFSANEIVARFHTASELAPYEESPHYHLGHYYDLQAAAASDNPWTFHHHTCTQYLDALRAGTKYIYQTMPRMLTLWLDMGESKELLAEAKALKKGTKPSLHGVGHSLRKITAAVDSARKELPEYQWLTAFPQLVSRIGHINPGVSDVLMAIILRVLLRYPQQAVWSIVGVLQSKKGDRNKRCTVLLSKAIAKGGNVERVLSNAQKVAGALLRLCLDGGTEADAKGGRKPVDKDRLRLSMATHFYYVERCLPSCTILPLQDSLTCTLPTSATTVKTHNPFPETAVEIQGFDDVVEVMPSLQRPKKIVFLGSDGKKYPFLCKPHDDLRKDARLMDFNSMINKLLNSASESRRRNLHIRTYAVMPLNEECGLLEWVPNTTALRSILEKGYSRHGKKLYSSEIYRVIDEARPRGLNASAEAFDQKVVPSFKPAVFHEWFLVTWPEPSAWLNSRLAYARTLAVMSMIGFVLGLGDRHGENILFDSLTGDTVHVDFNCLFEKGKTFEIPERVPFRLTHNMVDALGVTGVEGVYRKAAEIAMEILRDNKDSLTSVLEAFVHDPLVEWEQARQRSRDGKRDIREWADQSLQPIEAKLRGLVDMKRGMPLSVTNQVETLIKQATSSGNLGAMYQGWAAWL